MIRIIVDQINADPHTVLRWILADGLERNFLLGIASHAGKYSCIICLVKGETRFQGCIYFPPATSMNAELRTHEQAKKIVL